MKKVYILNGHPDKSSLCAGLAQSYYDSASQSGASCKLTHLIDLEFEPVLRFGYKQRTELEPDLLQAQKDIAEADHLVMVYPTWWASCPALLKGFIDRVFLPQFAFKYRENSLLWDKLLNGKSARIIVTMDTPRWYNYLVYNNSNVGFIKKGVLEFCGVKPVKVSIFGPVKSAADNKRKNWINEVKRLGASLS
jgi:NAD(P)H dehydrogenase (quinone)